MWCLVSQPNSVVIEVEVDLKAKGQECLEKVICKLNDRLMPHSPCNGLLNICLHRPLLVNFSRPSC